MSDAIFQTAGDRIAQNHKDVTGAVPPLTIINLILDAIKSVLANCPAPTPPAPAPAPAGAMGAQVQAQAANPTIGTQFVVRRAVRQTLQDQHGIGAYRQFNGDAMVQTILKTGAASTPEEIETLIQT